MRTLKFRHDLPFYLEMRLINKIGYHIQSRVFKETITFARSDTFAGKLKPIEHPKPLDPPLSAGLSEEKCAELEKRCDRICNQFADPYNMAKPIIQRLANIAQGLPRAEQEYIDEYIMENFPEEEGLKL